MLREGERASRDLSGFRLYAFASALVVEPDDEEARRPAHAHGHGRAVIGDLERFAAHGYAHVTLHFDARSGTISEFLEIIEGFAEEVLPAAREIEARSLA